MSRFRLAGIVIETDWPLVTDVPPADPTAVSDLTFRVVERPPRHAPEPPLRFEGVGDLWLESSSEWSFHLTHPEHDYQVEVYLLGVFAAQWLERRGTAVLHGSAVTVGSHAVGFLGSNGAGKTSLALAMIDRGGRLLTDDLLAVPIEDGIAVADPTFPQVRLWPDDAEQRFGNVDGLELAHPGYSKLRVPIPADSFSPTPAPLTALYLPRRGADLAIEEVRGSSALFSLMSESFSVGLNDRPDQREAWMARTAALLEVLKVFTLAYPDSFGSLPDVSAAVAEHSARIQSNRVGGTAASNGA